MLILLLYEIKSVHDLIGESSRISLTFNERIRYLSRFLEVLKIMLF